MSNAAGWRSLPPLLLIPSLAGILLLGLLPALTPAQAPSVPRLSRLLEAVVTQVADGDTLIAETNQGTTLRLRLAGIDAPEIAHGSTPGQPYGEEARAVLTRLTLGKLVQVTVLGVDRYQRLLACVEADGALVNRALVEAGLAEVYRGGRRRDCEPGLEVVEAEARAAKRGMWARGAAYESPAAFRQRMRLQGD